MTQSERQAIFSKEALSVNDIQQLMGVSYAQAALIIRNIRRRQDRLGIRGKIHVLDYIEYYNLPRELYTNGREDR